MTETTAPLSAPTAFQPADGTGYQRVLLKLSGEAFGGGKVGIDSGIVHSIAEQLAEVVHKGTQVAVVVGGGNFFRGAELAQAGMDRRHADYMGMLGTVMNALALQAFCEQVGLETRVQTAITMGQVAEPYIPRKAVRHLEKGRLVIFGAGAGMPYFSTDTVAAQRAMEIGCQVLLMAKNGVDGVYDDDPGSTRRPPCTRTWTTPRCWPTSSRSPTPRRSAWRWRTGCPSWCSTCSATATSPGRPQVRGSAR